MRLFFDRSVGTAVPRALQLLLPRTVEVTYHQELFRADEQDDIWLPVVGQNGWFVVGQDQSYHKKPNELYALVQYNIGCFYLWGSRSPKWETMRAFSAAYDRIIEKAQSTERPFIYIVNRNGTLTRHAIPKTLDMFDIPENSVTW